MRHETSLMGDLLKRIPWDRCDAIVDKHAADRRVRTLSTKSQLIARLHGQLSGAVSLRVIVTTRRAMARSCTSSTILKRCCRFTSQCRQHPKTTW